MTERPQENDSDRGPSAALTAHVRRLWYALMVLGGLGFGLIGDRRPFGNDLLAHPVAVFFVVAAGGLLLLRIALARPVPDLLPERAMLAGCLIGGAAFLVGNWVSARLIPLP
jgi:hypothetical protein